MSRRKRRKLCPVERMAEAAGLPMETDGGILKITVLGHRRALIENHRGIHAYTEKGITLMGPEGPVSIYGRNLEIIQLNNEHMLVDGYITGAVYE